MLYYFGNFLLMGFFFSTMLVEPELAVLGLVFYIFARCLFRRLR